MTDERAYRGYQAAGQHAAAARAAMWLGSDHLDLRGAEAALDDLRLAGRRRGVHAGDVGRDLRGRPTGELWEAVFGRALQRALADTEACHGAAGLAEVLRAEARRHLAYGITHAHDPCVSPAMHDRMLELRSGTALRLSWGAGSAAGILNPPGGPAAAPAGPYGDAGREVKLFLDGADRCGLRLPLRALPGLVGGPPSRRGGAARRDRCARACGARSPSTARTCNCPISGSATMS